ncbi:MAG: class I SAM-dependent methyltransferase [Dehalococcoidia bacterium]|nr:Ubiquinone/menaquinone biosynthesis C-methyltransferase UbiE [Chloroflexota bacterium]MBT9159846.1 Ubiquinone/menaquinone biosynthesis C-methyltransferase UbiE [Chloroflexota bacterium]MBT9161865.1 Ubiquinone/menaquinone biosynthesis C-methyltransferase UbiE [Chloroflexota bacterium]
MTWADEWRKLVLGSSLRKGGDPFTSREFVEWYDRQLEHNGYPGILLDKVRSHLNKGSTVLDIGAGTGAFAIPLAQLVKEVMVVEPSPQMLARLGSKMNNLTNIHLINQRWEDVNIEEVGIHDMIIAAHSLYDIIDIETILKKMISAAKKHLYIIMGVGRSDFYADIWQHFKEEYHPPPSFIYAYNVLYEMGILADVEIVQTPRSQVYSGIGQAVKHWTARLDLPSEKEDQLRAFLRNRLKEREGLLYFEEKGQTAIIRYEKKC